MRPTTPPWADAYVREVVAKAEAAIAKGWTVYFKVTCNRCGKRPLFQEPNTVYEFMECCACGASTPTVEGRLGFLTMMQSN